MKQNIIPELDKLFDEVGTYRKSSEYRELLEFVRRFRNIAPYNAMLLHIQNPQCSYVASVSDWRQRFGRYPKENARPLVILRPFGPVSFVYDLQDTEGQPFPERALNPFKAYGDVSEAMLHNFIVSAEFDGFICREQNSSRDLAGFIQTTYCEKPFKKRDKTEHFKQLFEITLNASFDSTDKLATLFHELGHAYCGHLNHPEAKWIPQRCGLPLNNREFEAESVCWILCERLGIQNPSAAYLNWYLDKNEEIPQISVDSVLKAVTAVEHILNGLNSPRKELIVSKNDKQTSLFQDGFMTLHEEKIIFHD